MINYSNLIEEMIQYKESLGYSRKSYWCYLKDLEDFLNKSGPKETISISDILPWCAQRPTEKASGFKRRVTAAREFVKYLFAMGKCDALIPNDIGPRIVRYTPYIFTSYELRTIFKISDLPVNNSRNPLASEIISTIFRLIYLCGLRPNEGRTLLRRDFDIKNRTILIQKNKTRKERLIPMAEDVSQMCSNYFFKRDVLFSDSIYAFPSPCGNSITSDWLTDQFLRIWLLAFPEKKDTKVRVYDLRHTFATTVFMNRIDQGEDCYTILPYLSAYMGHSSFRETAYYIHLLPERLKISSTIDWNQASVVFPEVPDYE